MQTETSLVPGQGGPRLGQRYALNQPRYMTENWRMILGLFDPDDPLTARIRYVRVMNRVATISQGDLMLRTPIGLPNGFYELSLDDELVYADHCDEDVRSPVSANMPFSENIPREAIHSLVNWVVWRREQHPEPEKSRLSVDRPGLFDERETYQRFQFKSRENPGKMVDLPITKEPLTFYSFHLRLALTEATRYDTVVIAHERHPDRLMPLFIGKNWKQCVLVMPQPTYQRHTRLHG